MSEPSTIRVEATGTASAAPDVARATLFTFAEDQAPGEALSAASELCGRVIAALRAAGVAGSDLVTAAIELNERHHPKEETAARAYRASCTIEVTVREPAALGRMIAVAVEAAGGGVGVGNVAFDLDDRVPLVSEARRRAVVEALRTGRELAQAAGVGLGRLLELSETGPSRPGPGRPLRMMAQAAAGRPLPPPVELGELSVSVTVAAVFELLAAES